MRRSDLFEVMRLDALCLPVPWSEEVWRSEFASLIGVRFVFEEDGAIAGQICSKHILDELHVTTLAVHPDHRRRGIATALVGATAESVPEARTMLLEVRVGNGGAISFYENLGFVGRGLRVRYYGDEDALVMVREL